MVLIGDFREADLLLGELRDSYEKAATEFVLGPYNTKIYRLMILLIE